MDETKLIGKVFSVTNASISVALNDDVVIKPMTYGAAFRVGQVGTYVVMPEYERSIIATVVSARDTSVSGETPNGKRILEVKALGTLQTGRFERGLSALPVIGSPVYSTDDDDLRAVFATFRGSNFSLGNLSMFAEERLYIDPNRFFSKHIALFGSTGSGKSSTVASIIQKVHHLQNTHVIMLDLHGEYVNAFKETGNLVNIAELELPYWLMNFEELVETFIDENEPSANNQIMVLKEAVLDSKKGKNLALKELINVDTPVFFEFLDVSVRMKSLDTERTLGGKEGPFYGQFTRFLVRLESKLGDKRYEFLFRPKYYRSSDKFGELLSKLFGLDSGKKITIIDLSRVPFDVVNVLISLLGRVIYDFNLWNKSRRDFPILIVFEEAHNYLSSLTSAKAARKTVERIAKEGRKYGVSCMIVSQRPAEISETIVSQCNNFIALRLLNPNDQNYVRKLVPDSQSDFIDVLPTLRQGEAFVIGDAVALPVRVQVDMPQPPPGGADIRFYDKWMKSDDPTDVKDVVESWWKQIRTF